MRVKLYRWRDEQWKERGVGNCKLMRDKAARRVRVVMRQEKTLKPVGNFMLSESPLCELVPMANNDKAWVWSCKDYSEETEGSIEKLAARFQNAEAAKTFKEAFDAGKEFNSKAKVDGCKDEDLVWAPTVEDIEEPVVDDIDTNKTADADGDDK